MPPAVAVKAIAPLVVPLELVTVIVSSLPASVVNATLPFVDITKDESLVVTVAPPTVAVRPIAASSVPLLLVTVIFSLPAVVLSSTIVRLKLAS